LPGVVVLDDGLGEGDAAAAVSVVAPYKMAPVTPPTSIDPAMAAAATDFQIPFTGLPPVLFDRSLMSVETKAEGGRSARRPRTL